MEYFVAPLGHVAGGVENGDRPTECTPSRLVLDRQRVIDRALGAGVADVAAKQVRLGIMGANVRSPFELAGGFLLRLDDDVGDLARKAGDAEAGGVDDLDPLNVSGADLLQLVDRSARLVGDSLAVDQHIF